MCTHLREFEATPAGAKAFECLRLFLDARASASAKVPAARCATCSGAVGRVLACLQCAHFSCRAHVAVHASQTSHYLFSELGVSVVLCTKCGDYVQAQTVGGDKTGANGESGPPNKRRRSASPQPPAIAPMLKVEGGPCAAVALPLPPSQHVPGLRGLFNLGNTCYLNCVLQSLAHNPLLRNYFLSDSHGLRSCCCASADGPAAPCLGCELDTVVADLFGGASAAPYSPCRFLYATWRNCAALAITEQHDAHEALIATLNGMHSHLGGASDERVCTCVVHSVFSGTMQSDLRCTSCGGVSSTTDPVLDVSLDIPHVSAAVGTDEDLRAYTLQGCLERFTRPELLEHSERFNCSKCNTLRDCHKQLSLSMLPNVICFHLKRFDSTRQRRFTQKVETKIEFPCTLDMLPFTAASKSCPPGTHSNSTVYELFAVINHLGRINSGHYTCFVRRESHWYKCDDAVITRVSVSNVLSSEAYLLFYVKKTLDYLEPGPDVAPSVSPIS